MGNNQKASEWGGLGEGVGMRTIPISGVGAGGA